MIEGQMKNIKISVTEFAIPVPLCGSIDISSVSQDNKLVGIAIHQSIQEKKKEDILYNAEVKIQHNFTKDTYVFEVSGRIDGLYQHNKTKIEEIKTTFNIQKLSSQLIKNQNEHPYCLQLKTYGYFHWLKTNEIPLLNFHLVSNRTRQSIDLEIELDIQNYEIWLEQRLKQMVEEAEYTRANKFRRKKAAKKMTFPFANLRVGQSHLVESVKQNMLQNKKFLVQAPTGLGKTIGVLFPVLQESLSRGNKAIYVTPKNSQYKFVENSMQQIRKNSAAIKSITLTAKHKICFKEEPICNPEYCEFAKEHYTKVTENRLELLLNKKRKLSKYSIEKIAKKYEVCPYELQFEAIKNYDLVICDYNYVFSPHNRLKQIRSGGIGQSGKPNLIIDEFHNLPSRGMEYFTSSISKTSLDNFRLSLTTVEQSNQAEIIQLLDDSISLIKSHKNNSEKNTTYEIQVLIEEFKKLDVLLKEYLNRYLESQEEIVPHDPVMHFIRYWSNFVVNLDYLSLPGFFSTYTTSNPLIKIICCDASLMLKESYSEFKNVVGFSATLKPFDYYINLSGLDLEAVETLELEAPFSATNRKILIIPQISSKYSDRARSYARIAETILKIVNLKKGNYFAFFPSFDFMNRVFDLTLSTPEMTIIKQESLMGKDRFDKIIKLLQQKNQSHLIFAVQGGIFSEGIDYLGDMAIGAFIVGPALPSFNLERELMKKYYDRSFGRGYDFAYTYPAMAKSVQASGRVIRSENDKGIIILMDDRFISPQFVTCMPVDWFSHNVSELISKRILADLNEFWETPHILT
jgi:DNA excision repair protein ERCC-2